MAKTYYVNAAWEWEDGGADAAYDIMEALPTDDPDPDRASWAEGMPYGTIDEITGLIREVMDKGDASWMKRERVKLTVEIWPRRAR